MKKTPTEDNIYALSCEFEVWDSVTKAPFIIFFLTEKFGFSKSVSLMLWFALIFVRYTNTAKL